MDTALRGGTAPECREIVEVSGEQDGIHPSLHVDENNEDMVVKLEVVDSKTNSDQTVLQLKASAGVSYHAGSAGAKFIIMDEFEDELLIEEVKKSPILYDKSHLLSKDLEKKKEVWEDVGEQIGMDGEIAKKRWVNIRDAFQAYLNRLIAASRSHDPPRTIKKYKYAHLLDFLLAHMKSGRSFQNAMQFFEYSSAGSSSLNILPSYTVMPEFADSEMDARRDSSEEGRKSDGRIDNPSKSSIELSNKRKRKLEGSVDVDRSMIKYRQVQSQGPSASARDDDGTESFFKAMAAAVRKLPNRAKAEVKLQIHQIVQQAELKYLYPINDPQVSQGPSGSSEEDSIEIVWSGRRSSEGTD